MLLELVAINVNFSPMSMCQRVNVVRSVFCHSHVSFLAKPLLTFVNLVCPMTVYNIKSLNLAPDICSVSISAFYCKYPPTLFLSET